MKLSFNRSLLIAALVAAPALAQPKPEPPASAPAAAAPAGEQPAFTTEELEQILAPIALYPDSLLSQILMASTYSVEVVEAERWVKANASLKGDALAKELEDKTWDPSVKSLANFPDVLTMMSQNLETTIKIGDAFIGQQKEVMDTVQKLRAKAKASGNLESSKEQKVTTQTDGGTQVIVVESSSPETVYVPQYNPTVVYGTWPYPASPPAPYYPPGYVASSVLSFGVGVACGVAWGYAWGNCNWGGSDVNINVNKNANFNNNINRSKYQSRQGSFKHDPAHRQGAAYRNSASAQKVGAGKATARPTQSNEFRGKTDAGRNATPTNRAGANTPNSPKATAPSTANRSSGNALNDGNRSGAAARDASSRGSASRAASPSSTARPSGGSRGGGGGSRGGGGRGGGRR